MCDLTKPEFTDADKARIHLENLRWPNGPVCPHCGGIDRNYPIKADAKKKIRPGLYKCGDCGQQFTVTVGTVFENSRIPLNKWLVAVHLMCASKKGISSHQLHRMLDVTYKTAWFMTHRIREAMREDSAGLLGGGGKAVEADETYIGGKEKNKHRSKRNKQHIGGVGKQCVFSLVERGGKVRSQLLPTVNAHNLKAVLKARVDTKTTRLMTDGEGQYRLVSHLFASHEVVNHSDGEYVRGEAYTNTVEGYFSLLKRGIVGTFHHVSPQHLARYVAEFDFRYNHREIRVKTDGKWEKSGYSDATRALMALKGIEGKRLMYKPADQKQEV